MRVQKTTLSHNETPTNQQNQLKASCLHLCTTLPIKKDY